MSTLTIEAGMVFDDLGTLSLDIVEDGNPSIDVDISTGEYFHEADASSADGPHPGTVAGYAALDAALKTAWEAVPTTASSVSVTFDRSTGQYTLSATGLSTLTITLNTLAQNVLGFSSPLSGALSYTSTVTPYYWIDTTVGCRSRDTRPYEGGDDVAADTFGHDGTPGGLAKDGAPMFWDWTCPLETYTQVWKIHATAGTPWTWEHFFPHSRNTYPFAVYDGTDTWFHLLRAEGSRFKPSLPAADYYGEADIRLLTKYLGKL